MKLSRNTIQNIALALLPLIPASILPLFDRGHQILAQTPYVALVLFMLPALMRGSRLAAIAACAVAVVCSEYSIYAHANDPERISILRAATVFAFTGGFALAMLTLRERNQQLVRESAARRLAENRYANIWNTSFDAQYLVSLPDLRFLAANEAGLRIIGAKDFAEISGRSASMFSADEHPEAASGLSPEARALLDKVLLGEPVEFDWPGRRLDGTPLPVRVKVIEIANTDGEPPAMLMTLRDRSQQIDTEKRLTESEASYRQTVESLPQLVWTCRADGQCDYLSPQWLNYTGVPEAPQLGFGWLEQLHPDDRQRTIDQWAETAAKGLPFQTLFRIRRTDGEYRWFDTKATALKDDEGNIIKWFGSNTDVDLQIRSQQRLRDSEALFRAAFNAASIGFALFEGGGALRSANPAFCRMTGYTEQELQQLPPGQLDWPEDREKGRVQRARLVRREIEHFVVESRIRRKDGEAVWTRSSVSGIYDPTSSLQSVACLIEDLSQSRSLEEQLRETQKMEAIGQLAGGLAHDFNNMLNVVIGNLDMIGEAMPDDDKFRRWQGNALTAALRCADVTRSLLAVARRQPLRAQSLDLNSVVSEMLPLLRSSVGAAVTVEWDASPEELVTEVDTAGLSSALLNLVINARDAMQAVERDRRITLRTRRSDGRETMLQADDYAVLEVIDNGAGISPELVSRVFEPFFSTKERGHGTGLGLPMVRGFAEQLGGTARIQSTLGVGTTASIFLPLKSAA